MARLRGSEALKDAKQPSDKLQAWREGCESKRRQRPFRWFEEWKPLGFLDLAGRAAAGKRKWPPFRAASLD